MYPDGHRRSNFPNWSVFFHLRLLSVVSGLVKGHPKPILTENCLRWVSKLFNVHVLIGEKCYLIRLIWNHFSCHLWIDFEENLLHQSEGRLSENNRRNRFSEGSTVNFSEDFSLDITSPLKTINQKIHSRLPDPHKSINQIKEESWNVKLGTFKN